MNIWAYFNKYAIFRGRSRRSEFITVFFVGIVMAIIAIAVMPFVISFLYDVSKNVFPDWISYFIIGVVIAIVVMAICIPLLAVTVRRLHDINISGWLLLIILIPCAVLIIFIIVVFVDGNRFTNSYGISPKYMFKSQNALAEFGRV